MLFLFDKSLEFYDIIHITEKIRNINNNKNKKHIFTDAKSFAFKFLNSLVHVFT